MAANLSLLPTSHRRRPRDLACDVTVKRPINHCVTFETQRRLAGTKLATWKKQKWLCASNVKEHFGICNSD